MTDIEFLQSQFDKVYVLTVPRMQERHALLQSHLLGLPYQLFFGIDKNDLDLQVEAEKGLYNNELYLKYNKDGKQMRLGVYCCAFGHRAIYEDMIHNNIERALILEDDALIIKENLPTVKKVFQQMPINWDLLYLGYEKNDTWNFKNKVKSLWYQIEKSHPLLKLQAYQYQKYYAKPLTENIWYAGFHDCTHAYAITIKAAQKLLQMQTPIIFKSDSLLSYAVTTNALEAYIAKPKIFDQLSIKDNAGIASLVTEN